MIDRAIRNKLYKALKSLEKILLRKMAHKQIVEEVRIAIRPFGAKVEANWIPELDSNEISLSGMFDSDRIRQPICVTLLFSSNHEMAYTWNEKSRHRFMFELGQVLQHEMIHKSQNEHRLGGETGFKVEQDKISQQRTYLSNKDEIGAYAHDIALEIVEHYGGRKRFKTATKLQRKKLVGSYKIYQKAFAGTDWSITKKALYKKIYKCMEEL
jgi:hypothetical protein|tara:strand:- start:3465 stop:4100 length:636 start_codon:yes stop_codon:yes gene_type:complete